MQLNIVDLFSGIGGFSLGLHNADKRFKTIAFAENDPFCQKVLQKNFGDTRIFNDIREVTIDEPVFLVCGGFPCQGFSVAGKQRGTNDDRYLWGEMFDVIKQTKPRWVIAENVRGIVTTQDGLAFNIVHSDLESEGYEVQAFNIPAIGKGAWHKRERIWFIANSKSKRFFSTSKSEICNKEQQRLDNDTKKIRSEIRSNNSRCSEQTLSNSNARLGSRKTDEVQTGWTTTANGSKITSNSNELGTQVSTKRQLTSIELLRSESKENWWQTQSKLCGVPDGISYGLDKDRAKRIKALGNAIVPQIIETIGKAIIKSENL